MFAYSSAASKQALKYVEQQEALKKAKRLGGQPIRASPLLRGETSPSTASLASQDSMRSRNATTKKTAAPANIKQARRGRNRSSSAGEAPSTVKCSLKKSATRHTTKEINEPHHTMAAGGKNVPQRTNNKGEDKRLEAAEALDFIQSSIEKQEQREVELDSRISAALKEARVKYIDGNKRTAIRFMKKVKLLQSEKNKIEAAIETMEAQILSIESAINNYGIMEAMQAGSCAMENLHSNQLTVECVDLVMENVSEMADYAAEISAILSKPIDNIVMDDEEALLRELLQDEQTQTNIQEINLPIVPRRNPTTNSRRTKFDKASRVPALVEGLI